MRVHRSACVARTGMNEFIIKDRRMWISLPDGSMVTASRQHQDEVREFHAGRGVGVGVNQESAATIQLKPQ